MISRELINQINRLARKQKETGLTPAEKKEQAKLRQIYLQDIRKQVVDQLSGVRPANKRN
jgi:uncharacterized protein YnzC (UPF0291/DUF896 family)